MRTDTNDYSLRFGGIQRLYGTSGLDRLRQAHVCVIGIGGVGSWAVEALARTGVGALTLVDLDEVCVSNVNRQLHALDGEIGKPKVEVMAARCRAINPECCVHTRVEFFTEGTAQDIFSTPFTFVLDAIDNVSNKCLLLALARDKGIPIMTMGGAGGRRDPTVIKVADLAFTTHDRLLQEIRRTLRGKYGFSRDPKTPFGIDCVFSPEPVMYPQLNGTVCATRDPENADLRLNCESGYGTATFVTGAFAFVAVSRMVEKIVQANASLTPTENSKAQDIL